MRDRGIVVDRRSAVARAVVVHGCIIVGALLVGVLLTALRPGGFADREVMAAAAGRNCGVIDRGPWVAAGGALAVLLWMVTYSSIIVHRSREPGIPWLVACLMWGHELSHAVFIRFDGTAAMDILEASWLALDTVIVMQAHRRRWSSSADPPWAHVAVLGAALLGATVLSMVVIEAWSLGPTLAFAINLVIAVAFAVRVYRGGPLSGVGLLTRAAAGIVVLLVNTLGFPYAHGFADSLCARSPNNLVSVGLTTATVLVDAWTVWRWSRRAERRY